jgi:sugar lactone lactonase YvrE
MRITKLQNICLFAFGLCCAVTVLLGQAAMAQKKVFTVAGGAVRDGGPATDAALNHAEYTAYDKQGNLYIADHFAHRIRKVNKNGIISTIAGNGISGYSGDGGPAKSAMVSFPTGLVIDGSGNIWFSDNGNNRVRKIDGNGVINTVAGNGTAGYSGDGGPATSAELNSPWGLAVVGGKLYIADFANNVVRRVKASGIINTVAGNGTAGFSGDGGRAKKASLNLPIAVVAQASGVFYVADLQNRRVRQVDGSGIITTFAGNGSSGCTGDGGLATAAAIGSPNGLEIGGGSLLIATSSCGRVRAVDLTNNTISTMAGSTAGFNGDGHPPLSTQFLSPHGLEFDASGELTIVDTGNNRVRKLDSGTQTVLTIAGGFIGDGGSASASSLHLPLGIGFDPSGDLFIADSDNQRIRKVDGGGSISTPVGTGFTGYTGDGGPATQATLLLPQAVAADSAGNIFLVDQAGSVLRKVDGGGTINSLPNPEPYTYYMTSLVADSSGNVYAADVGGCVVWKITPADVATIVAGIQYECGFNGDGIPATQAMLSGPWGVAVDAKGRIYIADYASNRVRKINAAGIINTLAGNDNCAFGGDGGKAKNATLCSPQGVAVAANGSVYIADTGNARVRVVNPSGVIQTLAGTGSFQGYNGDGLAAKKTNLDYLAAVAVSPDGVVYLVDEIQARVRKIE